MRILYIHKRIKQVSGGSKCQEANLEMLQRIAGIENVSIYTKELNETNKWKRNVNRFLIGRYADFKRFEINQIIDTIEKRKIDLVFFDGSQMGLIAKKLKSIFPSIRIITFFHNVELLFLTNDVNNLHGYQHILGQIDRLNTFVGEMNACKYSDIVLSLNQRDADQIFNIYHKIPDKIIPISLKDEFDISYIKPHHNIIPIGLMVGSYFPPNVKGLDWFVSKVLPYVKMKFIVVGSGMDKLTTKYANARNLEIHGFVEDLEEYYAKADFMIMPIFEGSGMKVKTAEALEYGKYIIAAPEAAVGYNSSNKEMDICSSAEDFITAINSFKKLDEWNGFNQPSRELFLKQYSYDSLEKSYREIFDKLQHQLL